MQIENHHTYKTNLGRIVAVCAETSSTWYCTNHDTIDKTTLVITQATVPMRPFVAEYIVGRADLPPRTPLQQWLLEFFHNCIIHPLLPFLPRDVAHKLHECNGVYTFQN